MKKCPHCQADIEENANFCLYCMTALREKTVLPGVSKKRFLLPLVAVLLAGGIVAALMCLPGEVGDAPQPSIPQTTDAPTEPPQTQTPQVAFTYRQAQRTDVYSATYNNTGGDIVITGIETPSPDGQYQIPAYMDDCRVIAIAANAFADSNAVCVYVPETVSNICQYAFYNCALTDLYISGEKVYLESYALPEGVTIHCSATCHDTVFHTYKDYAERWGYRWEEWNG